MPHPKLLVLTVQYEVQLKVRPTTCREGSQEEQGYSSAYSAVDGIGGQRYTLAALPPGEGPGIYLRLGGPHDLGICTTMEKTSCPNVVQTPNRSACSE